MTGKIEARLSELGIALPEANPPVANYAPFVISDSLIFVSGQVSIAADGSKIVGKVGGELDAEAGAAAARACGLNLLAHLKNACNDDLDRVRRVVRLGGFVNCTPEFTDQPKVIDGASDLMVHVFGDAGRHSRAAVGVASLPLGVAVEIDGVFEIA